MRSLIKKKAALLCFLGIMSGSIYAQVTQYKMSNNTITGACIGTFTDSRAGHGLTSGVYGNNENFVMTFCSGSSAQMTFLFTQLDIRTGDNFRIYDGPTTASPLLYEFTNVNPGDLTITSTGSCLTFHFTSDGSGGLFSPNGKWSAGFACVPGSELAADHCIDAPTICSMDGYFGSTSSIYTATFPGNFCHDCPLFLGSIENNSWLRFIAADVTVTLEVTIFYCHSGNGIQFGIYQATDCNNFTIVSNPSWTSSSGAPLTPGSTNSITATGLIPGQTYYVMVDGYAGDVCPYIISAESGIQIGAVITPDQTICPGEIANVSVNVQQTEAALAWSALPPDPTLAGQETNSSINVSPSQTTTYTIVIFDDVYNCYDTVMTSTVTVLDASDPNCDPTLTCEIIKTDATLCGGVGCDYDGPTILINEIMLLPMNYDGCIYGTYPNPNDICEGEWIELFNPDPCRAVDISCYFLGNNTFHSTGSSSGNYGGGFVLPPNSIVPPLGFALVRGRRAPPVPSHLLVANGGNTIEIVIEDANRICTGGGIRIWFPNAGGWFAFYDRNGVAQDAVSWANQSNIDRTPCNPTSGGCTYTGALASYNNISNLYKTKISDFPADSGLSFRRIPDGGPWQINDPAPPTYGTCNSACVTPPNATCDGTAQVVVTGNYSSYTFLWNDGDMGSTRNDLCAGTYSVTVTGHGTSFTTVCTVEIFEPNPPTITLTATNSCAGLETGNVVLEPNTGQAPFTYSWNTGANSQNLSNVGAGSYAVTVTDNANCVTEDMITVSEHAPVIVTVTPPADSVCAGYSANLTASGANTYVWQGDNINPTTGETVVATPDVNTTYTVTGTDNNTCTGSTTVSVTIKANPIVTASSPNPDICEGESTTLTATGANSYSWSSGTTPQAGATVTASPVQTTTFTVTGTTPDGCSDTALVTINILPNPAVNFTYNGFGCSPVSATFTDITPGNIVEWRWDMGDGAIITDVGNLTHEYTAEDNIKNYTVKLWVKDEFGCTAEISFPNAITVYPVPEASISANLSIISPGQTLYLVGSTHGEVNSWVWNFDYPDGTPIPTPTNEVNTIYNAPGTYTVYLLVTNEAGCSDTASINIEVIGIQIPNVFTPNRDGHNDKFVITNIEKLENSNLKVFNRWGRKVFEADNYQNDWDGENCSDGTYYYIVTLASGDSFNGVVMILR